MGEREAVAIMNVRAFAVYAHDKLPKHVSEDLLIVVKLAEQCSAQPHPKDKP